MRAVPWLILAACAGDDGRDGVVADDGAPSTDPTATTGDTGTVPTGGATLSATCEPQGTNVLRQVCTVGVEPPGAVEVSFAKRSGDGPTRTVTSSAALAEHVVVLYFMEAETGYDWVARPVDGPPAVEVTGSFLTGILPEGADVLFDQSGASSAPLVGMASPCADGAYAVIVDTASGRTVWYDTFSSTPYGFMEGASFTEDRTVLTVTDGRVVEVDLEGNRVLELDPGADLPERVHHDVFRKDGHTFVIFQEPITLGTYEWTLDGFYVFDPAGVLVAEWHLFDWFTPLSHAGGPFPDDYSHANAIWQADDGTILFSMRHLSAIAAIRGDLASPDFGEILWRMSNPTSEFGTDFTYTSATSGPADFERQHNVHLVEDGRMLLFDNRDEMVETSRAVELSFDAASGTAVFEQAYELPLHCDFQGGAMRTPAGHTLATCAPMRTAYEFDPAGALVWEAEAVCASGVGIYVPRFVPLEW